MGKGESEKFHSDSDSPKHVSNYNVEKAFSDDQNNVNRISRINRQSRMEMFKVS